MFSYIKDKIWNRLQSWKGKTISRAGKEILIKSVIQAIPSYVSSIFLLPISLCEEIERLMNKFWWLSNMEKSSGIRWLAWDKMCSPKKFGGMGFKQIKEFNIALLGKQIWRLLTVPHSFVARMLKARYFPACSVLNAGLGNNPSYVWRSVLAARDPIISGSIIKVGDGTSINIWQILGSQFRDVQRFRLTWCQVWRMQEFVTSCLWRKMRGTMMFSEIFFLRRMYRRF